MTQANQITSIDDINHLGNLVMQWHETQLDYADRLLDIPEGTEMETQDLTDGESTMKKIPLTGDTLHAFRVGVLAVLELFRKLPFEAQAEPVQTDDAAA